MQRLEIWQPEVILISSRLSQDSPRCIGLGPEGVFFSGAGKRLVLEQRSRREQE